MNNMENMIGKEILNYRIEQELGQGGMCGMYPAANKTINQMKRYFTFLFILVSTSVFAETREEFLEKWKKDVVEIFNITEASIDAIDFRSNNSCYARLEFYTAPRLNLCQNDPVLGRI